MRKSNLLLWILFFIASMPLAFAQSQALNGQIEGTISNQTGVAVESVTTLAETVKVIATVTIANNTARAVRLIILNLIFILFSPLVF